MANGQQLEKATEPARGGSLYPKAKALWDQYAGGKKPDTSWHDSMVKSAGDSFRKLTPQGPKLGTGKVAKKKATKKAAARKRQ